MLRRRDRSSFWSCSCRYISVLIPFRGPPAPFLSTLTIIMYFCSFHTIVTHMNGTHNRHFRWLDRRIVVTSRHLGLLVAGYWDPPVPLPTSKTAPPGQLMDVWGSGPIMPAPAFGSSGVYPARPCPRSAALIWWVLLEVVHHPYFPRNLLSACVSRTSFGGLDQCLTDRRWRRNPQLHVPCPCMSNVQHGAEVIARGRKGTLLDCDAGSSQSTPWLPAPFADLDGNSAPQVDRSRLTQAERS